MIAGPALAVIVVAGVAAGLLSEVRWADAASMAIAAASLGLLAASTAARAGGLLVALFFLAFGHGALERDSILGSPLRAWIREAAPEGGAAGPIAIEGVLARDAALVEGGVRLLVDLEWLHTERGRRWLPGRVQVHVGGTLGPQHVREWTRGRRVAAPVLLREPQLWRNPGSPSERCQQLNRPFDLAGTIKSAALVGIAPGRWWEEAAAAIRRHVRDATARHVAPRSAQAAAVVTAILIGDRAGLAEPLQRRLQAAGTYHVIAISGGNIAILAVLTLFVLRLIFRSFRAVALATMAVVLAYGWLVGGEPSVRRAVTAASLYLALTLCGLAPKALNVLALVALMLAAADPRVVLEAGAWLSFGATLGIILGVPRFTRWATAGAVPAAAPTRPARAPSLMRRIWLAVLTLFSATLAAELVLLPVSAALFSRAGLLGLVLNFVAIPAMTAAQVAGLGTVGLAGWWPAGAQACGTLAALAATALLDSSLAVDAAPWLVWRVPPTSPAWTVAFYAGLAAALFLRGRRRRQLAGLAAAGALFVILSAPGLERAGPTTGRLRLTMLDVGQGEAIAVQFPSGHALLVDAGGLPGSFDVGDRVITPALWALGVRQLDWLAVTHADVDHIGGALGVERNFRPREIWEGIPVPPHTGLMALRVEAHRHGLGWREILAGHRLELGSVVVEVVHPPRPDWERRRVRNEDSVVLRIAFGAVEFLLTGDAGAEFEGGYAGAHGRPPLRLLKIGHHGSRTSSSPEFVRSVSPHAAIVSAGRGNVFGHPVPDVLSRYEQIGTIVFRTDRDGAITMETDGAAVDVQTWSGRNWRLKAIQN